MTALLIGMLIPVVVGVVVLGVVAAMHEMEHTGTLSDRALRVDEALRRRAYAGRRWAGRVRRDVAHRLQAPREHVVERLAHHR